jgi:hypothetical protein
VRLDRTILRALRKRFPGAVPNQIGKHQVETVITSLAAEISLRAARDIVAGKA